MESFGTKIKNLRENKNLPLRIVSTDLNIDQAILSKIERNIRKANRELVIKISDYFRINRDDLLIAWLSDKLALELEDEDNAIKALKVAEEKVNYITRSKRKINLIETIKSVLKADGRVNNAYLFGSLARGEENFESDIDLLIELNQDKKYSMFDILDLEYLLTTSIYRKVDLVEKGFLKDFSVKSAQKDMIKIYG
ncbi:nucleotidyltransferase domain-containing protein [Pedobacter psychrophilus]|uniref:nucleotidyltransferase domain-containing protein n=1 Tax=Pedobacter psychrophilus TaxID=1826909 RepID=UPI00083AC749|nr:nucleotidyltransferase domain-containing protein [Pedobacter psychrophilus]